MIYLLSPMAQEGICHLPMIDFTLLDVKIDFTRYDILMFTSKQAVKSVEMLNKKWKDIPCFAIGSATAREIENLGGKVVYKPEFFYGETLSKDIIQKFQHKKILYLRPKEISFDSKYFLSKEGIDIKEQIIYQTSCVHYTNKNKPRNGAIIIFTSPSTIHCFFKNFDWDKSYTAVVIGESTKKNLPTNIKCVVADEPLIDACIKKAKSLI